MPALPELRSILAPDPSPFTLDGTRTYLVGRARVAIIDPGPAVPAHLDALAAAVADAERVTILITHDHPDHSAGTGELARRRSASVRAAASGTLAAGDRIDTDAGELVAVPTPGHTRDHFAFHWPAGAAVFCGDLVMGGQDTALVAAPEGDLAEYLASLERVRALRPTILYPTHGPPFTDAMGALDAYVRHREQRQRQVLAALAAGRTRVPGIVDEVYGAGLPAALREAAAGAVVAYLEYLEEQGRVRRAGAEGWERA